ncbi:hypothetical protein C8R45DRAFT_1078479 [Mycena sanguinolenta]|nr:hypothetical protein C8R45DRAFT_1078479 [Mycena sanguinolenta]
MAVTAGDVELVEEKVDVSGQAGADFIAQLREVANGRLHITVGTAGEAQPVEAKALRRVPSTTQSILLGGIVTMARVKRLQNISFRPETEKLNRLAGKCLTAYLWLCLATLIGSSSISTFKQFQAHSPVRCPKFCFSKASASGSMTSLVWLVSLPFPRTPGFRRYGQGCISLAQTPEHSKSQITVRPRGYLAEFVPSVLHSFLRSIWLHSSIPGISSRRHSASAQTPEFPQFSTLRIELSLLPIIVAAVPIDNTGTTKLITKASYVHPPSTL